ncbi:restriction endonuclease subunit R [Aerosakkonemataceae cyanobacterium BLCC-F50]|uniref:Restriction endonuclease subunit R n=1 Tax=Floridaenema flaviceps BLCC-F50 TaxID=3153642 RepID=A0ABV4Y523_9CYAN
MITLRARNLNLNDVNRLLNIEEKLDEVSFADLLTLEPITNLEQQEIVQICNDFRPYVRSKKVSEGQVKLLTVFPLLRLAGFYHYPIQINVEEGIDNIVVEDEDTTITGRFDIVAVNRNIFTTNNVPFWILVIESKELGVDVLQGLPQLLAYAYNSLERQSSVWGMVTNGLQYLFVLIQQGNPQTYQLIMPRLDLFYSQQSVLLLQVLKAICKLEFSS